MATFLVLMLIFGWLIWVCYALFCNWLFRLMLSGIGLPKSMRLEYKRERFMTFIVFLSLPMSSLGIIPLLGTYIAGIIYHFRQRREVEAGTIDASAIPIVPRMALNELRVMVFSLAFFPVMISGIIDAFVSEGIKNYPNAAEIRTAITVSAFVIGALIFPLCFASAYHRLEYNRIKDPRSRMAFLFVYPYMTFAMHILLVGTPIFGFIMLIRDPHTHEAWRVIGLFILGALTVMLTGISIGRRAMKKRAAEEPAFTPSDQSPVA